MKLKLTADNELILDSRRRASLKKWADYDMYKIIKFRSGIIYLEPIRDYENDCDCASCEEKRGNI